LTGNLGAQAPGSDPSLSPPVGASTPAGTAQLPGMPQGANLTLSLPATKRESLGTSIEIVLFMTLLSLAPAIVMSMTCFTRIIIVLSFLRRAMSMQDLPPTMVVTGFAVFMSIFIMKPVVTDLKDQAYTPYVEGQIDFETATNLASERMKKFMHTQTRKEDIALIYSLTSETKLANRFEAPFHVMVPAFILSEIKTAFQMGFVLFLPFVIIDLVIASILVSMGMFTLPPVVISTPLKILLFVMVDGWNLVIHSLAESFKAAI
jgi:flagellar biosynthetic protein FliP